MKQFKWIFLVFLMTTFSNQSIAQSHTQALSGFQIENLNAQDFYQLLKQTTSPQLIDVRTSAEFYQGHIPKAIFINYYDRNFMSDIKEAGLDTNKAVFIYCRSGHRSGNAIKIFKELGFNHIINLAYGINEWYRPGLPIEK